MLKAFSIRKWERWVLFFQGQRYRSASDTLRYLKRNRWESGHSLQKDPHKKMGHQQNSSQCLPTTSSMRGSTTLQQGKVHNPSTSKMTSWMAITITEFYERVERIVNLTKTENGLYQNITSFWIPGIGEKGGQLLHLPCKTSAKTA